MDRRVIKTKQAIRDSYLELIAKKKSTRISITEIARNANIDRKTFYLHYDSTSAVLHEYIQERTAFLEEKLMKSNFQSDPFNFEIIYQLINEVHKDDLPLLELISGSASYYELWNHIQRTLLERAIEVYSPIVLPEVTDEQLRMYADFTIAGIINLYRKWVSGDYDISLHELIQNAGDVARYGLEKIIAPQR